MTHFTDLALSQPIQRAILAAGYDEPTPIQAAAIPAILSGRDLQGIAQTGTGKTLAFAAPTLDHLCRNQGPAPKNACRVLVLAPTRELATQIATSFETYAQFLGTRVMTAFGGVKIGKQIRQLERGTHILVATPGRLEDLVSQGALSLDRVEVLILDEADQMLDLGFIHALRRIVKLLPARRQTLFFSATMPKSIEALAAQYISDPVKVAVTPQSTTAERVEQSAYFAEKSEKPGLLAHLLKQKAVSRALVFTRTKHGADKLVRLLARYQIEAVAIHGNKSQPQRQRALDAFRKGDAWVMIATDIAARGIDIDGLSHVFNYELPEVPEQYVHRIGRTGRAGRAGQAVSLVSGDEKGALRSIERQTRQQIPVIAAPSPDMLETPIAAPAAPEQNRGRGKTPAAARPQRQDAGKGASPKKPHRKGQAGRPARPGGKPAAKPTPGAKSRPRRRSSAAR